MLGVEGTKCVRGAISIRGVNGTRGATNISGIIATELYIGIELDVTSSIHVIEDITCTNCIHGKGLVGGCIWAIEGTCDLVIKVLSGIHVNTGALVALCIVGGIVINTLGLGVASNGAILSSCLSTCCLFGCYRYCLPYAASLLGATEGLLIINQFDSVAAPSSIMGLKQSLVSNPVLGINGNRVVLGSRLVTSMKWHDLRGVTDLSIGISINSNMSISISISSDSGSEVIPVTCNVIEGALDSIDGIVTMGQRLVSVIGATSMNGLRCVSCLHGSMCVMSGTVGCFSVGSLLDRLEGSTIGSVGSGIIGKELGILGIVVESVKVIDDIGAYTVGILNVEVKVTIGSTLVTDMGVNGILGSMDVIECIEVGSVVSVEVVGATRGIMVEGVKCIRSVLYTGMALEVSEVIRSTEGVRVTNINSTGIVGN